ncbi:ArsB/NhaD family transporter, partial [Escherichia coli]|uniref:ArsB/NhaD family transporter n=1 Tax=Escherichia coli TaxID=562 RepID=UPI00237B908F
IVIAMLLALGFSKGTTLAFVMAAGFIADTASLPLIVSNLVNIVSADFFGLGFTEYASVMVPVDIAAIIATLVMLHLFFRKDIPPTYDLALLKAPAKAIKDLATFRTGWIVLILLLVGFFVLEPLGIPVSAIAAVGAVILFAVAKRGHAINTGKVLRGAPWQIVIFSLGTNVIGCDLGPKITPIGSLATLLWLHVLSQKNMTITWGYYFRTGIVMTLPVLFVTLAALALRLS